MRIILDENVPYGLQGMLAPRKVSTVQKEFFRGLKNGALLKEIEGKFEVLVTADKNLRYQQNLSGRMVGIVELPTNRWPILQRLRSRIISAVDGCSPSAYIIVDLPNEP